MGAMAQAPVGETTGALQVLGPAARVGLLPGRPALKLVVGPPERRFWALWVLVRRRHEHCRHESDLLPGLALGVRHAGLSETELVVRLAREHRGPRRARRRGVRRGGPCRRGGEARPLVVVVCKNM